MYLRITSTEEGDSSFSFILSKNPHSDPFRRGISGGEGDRFVTGRYLAGSEQDYEIVVHNDRSFIVQGLKDLNLPTYVTAKPYAVLPYNLKGIAIVLKTAISGVNPPTSGISDEEFNRPRPLSAIIGPFTLPFGEVCEVYKVAGFEVEDVTTGFAENACVVKLSMTASVSGFLQRIYVLANYLTVRQGDSKYLEDDKIRSFMGLAKGWLTAMGEFWVDRITHRLSGGHKGLKKEFNDALITEEEDAESESRKGMEPAISERSMGLHERRHQMIVEAIVVTDDPLTMTGVMVELGCGNGKLLKRLTEAFPSAHIIGFEADQWDARKASRRAKGKVDVTHENFLAPYLELDILKPDVLVMTEVIEHLDKVDRRAAIDMVIKMWQPGLFVLTCPNVAYNSVIGLPDGTFRHHDHKIEHNWEEFCSEIIEPLKADYEIEMREVLPGEPIQPSFFLVAKRKLAPRHLQIDKGPLYRARDMHAPLYLEEVGYVVNAEEMKTGLTHPAYRNHRRLIPYLSPTMAPVDFNPEQPEFLEHPIKAFAYYAQRGIGTLAEQKKLMGSRCHIIVFRDREMALSMGYPSAAYGISRGGFAFFDDPADLARIHADVAPGHQHDMVILDCEVLPWSFKAGTDHRGLIGKQFKGPGESALLYKTLTGGDVTNAALFLRALSNYSAAGPLVVAPFGVLVQANLDGKGGYKDIMFGDHMTVVEQTDWMQRAFGGDLIQPVDTQTVDLSSPRSIAASIARWRKYTIDEGGEGFVYKPMLAGNMPDGSPIQPALKVRGPEYLRLIYGFDYLEKDIFPRLTKRGTGAKRRLAIQEAVLGRRILHAFLRNMHEAHARAVAGFLGMDGVTSAKIDQTL